VNYRLCNVAGCKTPTTSDGRLVEPNIPQHHAASHVPFITQPARATSRKSSLDTHVRYDRHSSPHYERW